MHDVFKKAYNGYKKKSQKKGEKKANFFQELLKTSDSMRQKGEERFYGNDMMSELFSKKPE